jgi:TPR repeat protein
VLGVLLAGGGFSVLAAEPPTDPGPRVRAEALYIGSAGRVDETAARALFEEAAAAGDPLARMRVATLRYLGAAGFARDRPAARREAREVAAEVERRAAAGDVDAVFLSGSGAVFGLGRRHDAVAGRARYEAAAARGHLWALNNLAWMYETGEGGEQDRAKAMALYRRAADAGSVRSIYEVGRLLLSEEPPRGAEGAEWIRRAAEAGYVHAMAALGNARLFGSTAIAVDSREGIAWLERAARAGSIKAADDLGFARKAGIGGAPDRAAAREWLALAAERGDRWAMVELGWLLVVDQQRAEDGVEGWRWIDRAAAIGIDSFSEMAGFRNDDPRERELIAADLAQLERVARGGSPTAQALWARVLSLGFADREDADRDAFEAARRAAAAGEPHAMRTLFHAYRHGRGVEKDPREAVRWLERGAAAGESFCAMFLSQELREGQVVPVDLEASWRWLERSAELGNYWAMLDLGNLHSEGWYGRAVDREEALRWKRRTAELGDAESIGWLRVHFPDEVP